MKQPLTIRLSPEARAALERLAQRDGRSMAAWIEMQVRKEALAQGAWSPRLTKPHQSLPNLDRQA